LDCPKTAIEKVIGSLSSLPLYNNNKVKQKFFLLGKANQKQNFKSHEKPNLVLANREARESAPSGNDFALKIQWAALRAARENIGKIPESQIVARLYDEVRTYFLKNS